MENNILDKWSKLIQAAKDYYIDSVPTGLTDAEYDELEARALLEDNFEVRAYVFENFLPKGARAKNSYVEKFKKEKVSGLMLDAIKKYGPEYYYDLKYDGTSLAIYIDPNTGVPQRAVTCGNSSLGWGIDQTWKIIGLGFLPKKFPLGIVAVQCECLIDLDRMPADLEAERARQKCNGIVNGKKEDIIEDAKNLLTLRAYRYYTDDSPNGKSIKSLDYRDVIRSFDTVYSPIDNHILFAPADIFTLDDLKENEGYCETDHTRTSTGFFLNDGYIVYDKKGNVVIGLKYSGAGSGELIKTKVKSIQWNSQVSKGKDSWSANVILDPPVNLHGSTVKKPSAGSVSKLIEKNITPGAEISIILANSTIPMVGDCFGGGNGDFMWPKCTRGYQMSQKDVYGSLLKCGNPDCKERKDRMKSYIYSLSDIMQLDLNKFLVIDRFDWNKTDVDIAVLLRYIVNGDKDGYREYLMSYMNTDLRKKNMDLVWEASYNTLEDVYKEEEQG